MKLKLMKPCLLLLLVLSVTAVHAKSKEKYRNSIPRMEDKNYVTYFTRDDFDDKYHDNIRFVSKTDDRVEFEVYAYNEKTQVWFLVGTAHLSHYDDTCFVDVDVRGFRLSKYNYFAVRPLKKKTYAYSYDVRHNDIYITVRDKD